MHKFMFCIFFTLFLYLTVCSQVFSQITALNRFTINRNDTVYNFFAKKPLKKVSISKGKSYYWYSGDTILITKEGYDNKVLDGVYKVYYPNKNLKEMGYFTDGLKSGEWKFWYPNGELALVEKWKNGQLIVKKNKKGKSLKKSKKSVKKKVSQ